MADLIYLLMYAMTSRACLVMAAMSLPCECSRRKLEVPMTTSTPYTPQSHAIETQRRLRMSLPVHNLPILASSSVHRVSKRHD